LKTQEDTTGDKKFTLDVPSKKKRHSSTYSNNILLIITKNNNILELQHFLKHNDFAKKFANKYKILMLEDLIKTN
jgi:hypothetical protein